MHMHTCCRIIIFGCTLHSILLCSICCCIQCAARIFCRLSSQAISRNYIGLFLDTILGYFSHFCLAISSHLIRIYRVPDRHCVVDSILSQCIVIERVHFLVFNIISSTVSQLPLWCPLASGFSPAVTLHGWNGNCRPGSLPLGL